MRLMRTFPGKPDYSHIGLPNTFHTPSIIGNNIHQGTRITLKDNICSTGATTSCASRILQTFTSPVDATVVTKIEFAPGVNKANMDEFGMGSHSTNSAFGILFNRGKDGTKYSAGGSSGGSALQVMHGKADMYVFLSSAENLMLTTL